MARNCCVIDATGAYDNTAAVTTGLLPKQAKRLSTVLILAYFSASSLLPLVFGYDSRNDECVGCH